MVITKTIHQTSDWETQKLQKKSGTNLYINTFHTLQKTKINMRAYDYFFFFTFQHFNSAVELKQ